MTRCSTSKSPMACTPPSSSAKTLMGLALSQMLDPPWLMSQQALLQASPCGRSFTGSPSSSPCRAAMLPRSVYFRSWEACSVSEVSPASDVDYSSVDTFRREYCTAATFERTLPSWNLVVSMNSSLSLFFLAFFSTRFLLLLNLGITTSREQCSFPPLLNRANRIMDQLPLSFAAVQRTQASHTKETLHQLDQLIAAVRNCRAAVECNDDASRCEFKTISTRRCGCSA